MVTLPVGNIVKGSQGSPTAFRDMLEDIVHQSFSGYLEVRMKIRGGELWGVVIFERGRLVESYANKMGTDVFGERAYEDLLELAEEPLTTLTLHNIEADNLVDLLLIRKERAFSVEGMSLKRDVKGIPGFGTPATEALPEVAQMPQDAIIKKVVLLGDPAVGKTSTIRRYMEDTFDESYLSTIGSNVNKKTVTVTSEDGPSIEVTMMIWDIAGDRACDSLRRAYFRGSHMAIVVCDISRRGTFLNLPLWIDTLHEVAGEIPIVLLGNKSDLDEFRQVDIDELHSFASMYSAKAFSTSARSGESVDMVFYEVAKTILS